MTYIVRYQFAPGKWRRTEYHFLTEIVADLEDLTKVSPEITVKRRINGVVYDLPPADFGWVMGRVNRIANQRVAL